jgi:hypothetical protein
VEIISGGVLIGKVAAGCRVGFGNPWDVEVAREVGVAVFEGVWSGTAGTQATRTRSAKVKMNNADTYLS